METGQEQPRGATAPPAQVPGAAEGGQGVVRPHRGTLILVLGILGLVSCFICGLFAWVMGNRDLRDMAAGRMDASGRDMTQAGRICGIIGSIMYLGSLCLVLCVWGLLILFWLAFLLIATAAG